MSVYYESASSLRKYLEKVVAHTMEAIAAGFYLTIYSVTGVILTFLFFFIWQLSTADLITSIYEFLIGQPVLSVVLIITGYLVKKAKILSRIKYFESPYSKPLQNLTLGPLFFIGGVLIMTQLPESIPELGPGGAGGGLEDVLASLFVATAYIGLLTICASLIVNGAARTVLNAWTVRRAMKQIYLFLREIYILIFKKNIIAMYWQTVQVYKDEREIRTPTALLSIFNLGIDQIDPGILQQEKNIHGENDGSEIQSSKEDKKATELPAID